MSFVSCEVVSDLDNAAGEFGDSVSSANFHAPSNMAFHENGAEGEGSVAGGVETSGS
jgi:hypothetical protein